MGRDLLTVECLLYLIWNTPWVSYKHSPVTPPWLSLYSYVIDEKTATENFDNLFKVQFSSAQLFSCVWLFVTPWTTARQASLSITNFWSPPKPMSIESVIPSNHLILCCPLLLLPSKPASGSFQMSQLFASGGQSTGVSASASVLPMNTQDWSPLGWTGWISLQSKGGLPW